MCFLKPWDYEAWSQCSGRPALEENEPRAAPREYEFTPDSTLLPLYEVTGEKGARAQACVKLKPHGEKSLLSVWLPAPEEESFGHLKLLALAAFFKYSLVSDVDTFSLGRDSQLVSLEELSAWEGEVAQAAEQALSLRGSTEALNYLKVGEYCKSCRAAHHCPQLLKEIV
jgi:hypothetical protein